ncbi:MAG TPA: monovalent cation/H+ antiporter complex subunit F [Egibacteraceae bacterium]|nr:monovalent cation/H+ antiporter complex subunit F [Egibacteraceae bacterium]
MEIVTTISLLGLGAAGVLCLARLFRPGSLADRIVALDTFLVISVMAIAVLSIRSNTDAFTPVLLVTALLAFVSTVTVAQYILRRGA